MRESIRAEECVCCICGKQAVAFWPAFDPDVPRNPYCRNCLNKAKMRVMLMTQEIVNRKAMRENKRAVVRRVSELPQELMSSAERYRAERNTRILQRFRELRRKYPEVTPGRIYMVLARDERMTPNSIKYIVTTAGCSAGNKLTDE